MPLTTVRPEFIRMTSEFIILSRDSALGKWVTWENFSSEPSVLLPRHLSVNGSKPFQYPGQLQRSASLLRLIQHWGQFPQPPCRGAGGFQSPDSKKEALPKETALTIKLPPLLQSPVTPHIPPFPEGLKREKKSRPGASLKKPRERTPPTSFQS